MQKSITNRGFNYSLFFSLMLLSFIPAINEAIKVLFIHTSEVSLNVVSQIEWFDLINEVLTVTLTIPMYSILSKYIKDKDTFGIKVFQCGVIVFTLYLLFSIITYFKSNDLVTSMVSTSSTEINTMVKYLRLETLAFIIGIIFTYLNVVFVILGKSRNICVFIIAKAIVLIISNMTLIPVYGSFGIAYSNILTNGLLSILAIILLKIDKEIQFTFKNMFSDKELYKSWFKVGCFQGLSVAIANIAYAGVVVKMINSVESLGDYWIANNFLWGWLLIPAFALGEVTKSECKNGYENLNTKEHYKVMLMTALIWVVSIPLWNPIFKYTMGVENTSGVFNIVLKSLPFYTIFILGNYLESIFQGIGKTNYCFLNNLIVNTVYYGVLYLLFRAGVINPSVNFVVIMFGFGMVVSCLISIILKRRYLDTQELEMEENCN